MPKKKYFEWKYVPLEEHTKQLKVQFVKQYSQKTSSKTKVCQSQQISRKRKPKSENLKLMRQKIKQSECSSPSILPADMKIIDGAWNDQVHSVRNENSSQTDSDVSIVFETNDDSKIVYPNTPSEMTKHTIKESFTSHENGESQKSHRSKYSSILFKTSRYPLRNLVTLDPAIFKSPPSRPKNASCLINSQKKSKENLCTLITSPPIQHPKKMKKSALKGKKSNSIPKKINNTIDAISATTSQIESSKTNAVLVRKSVSNVKNDSNKFRFMNIGKSSSRTQRALLKSSEPVSSINSQKCKAHNFTEFKKSYSNSKDSSVLLKIFASENSRQLERTNFSSYDSMNIDELGRLFATLIITPPTPESFLVYRNGRRGSLISIRNRKIRKNYLQCSLVRAQFMCAPKISFTRQSIPSTQPLVEPNLENCQLDANIILKKICTVTRKVPHFFYFEKY